MFQILSPVCGIYLVARDYILVIKGLHMTINLTAKPQTKPSIKKLGFPFVTAFFEQDHHNLSEYRQMPDDTNDVVQISEEIEQKWHYGWRMVPEEDEHGNTHMAQVPLTLEDYLHPQIGDKHMNTQSHNYICKYLMAVIEHYLRHIQGTVVYSDVGIKWDVPGVQHLAPDLSLIFNVRRTEGPPHKIFYVADEGTAPALAIEVTSPSTRDADFNNKLSLYARVGLPYYFIVDTGPRHTDAPPVLRLYGFELTPNGYVELRPNLYGWLWMDPVGAWIGLDSGEVRCYDAQENELPTPTGWGEALAEELAETSEQLAETSVARDEAERRAEEEALARAEAERRAEEEAQMRQYLEEQLRLLQAQLDQQK